MGNVRDGNCPVGIVRDGKCPVGIVRDGNCPGWELSGMGTVRDVNCPGWELSTWWELSGNPVVRCSSQIMIQWHILVSGLRRAHNSV